MKKICLILASIALLASCNSKKEPQEPVEVKAEDTITDAFKAENNSRLAIDYPGTYKGTLPSASGSGMEVTIVLADSTYTKSTIYVGKSDKPVEVSGKYTWDETGSKITLEGDEAPNQYQVGENQLFHLDMDGKRIEGNLADQYILVKQE